PERQCDDRDRAVDTRRAGVIAAELDAPRDDVAGNHRSADVRRLRVDRTSAFGLRSNRRLSGTRNGLTASSSNLYCIVGVETKRRLNIATVARILLSIPDGQQIYRWGRRRSGTEAARRCGRWRGTGSLGEAGGRYRQHKQSG